MQEKLEPAECPHYGIRLLTEPGNGYWLGCRDCGSSGFGAHVKAAREEFEHAVATNKRIKGKREK